MSSADTDHIAEGGTAGRCRGDTHEWLERAPRAGSWWRPGLWRAARARAAERVRPAGRLRTAARIRAATRVRPAARIRAATRLWPAAARSWAAGRLRATAGP